MPRQATAATSRSQQSGVSARRVRGGRRSGSSLVGAVLVAVLLAGVCTVAGVRLSTHPAQAGTPTEQQRVVAAGRAPTSRPAASRGPVRRVPVTLPPVVPMTGQADPDLFLVSGSTVTPRQVADLIRATHAVGVLQIDAARVRLGKGVTTAVGVDPSNFRNDTPENTASVDGLWQRVKLGELAVAHAVGSALGVKLGQVTPLGNGVQVPERVGAFATSRLPGVGVVLDKRLSRTLRLVPGAALVIRLPVSADPAAAKVSAARAVPGSDVQALRYRPARQPARRAAPPGRARVPAPVPGTGWTLPLQPGTFAVTQRFGHNGHPGVDLAAPLGTLIQAAAEGDVLYWGPAQGFGNWIVLQHPGGVQTVYGHMRHQDLLVPPAGHVTAGQAIARVGSEGDSTGPHLHFEVRLDGTRTDPVVFLRARGVAQISNAGLPG